MRAVWVPLLFSLALALPAGAQSSLAISSSTAAVTFTAAKNGGISAQMGACSGNGCRLSASTAAGSFVLSSSGPLMLAATATPGVFAVVQNGSLLFTETSGTSAPAVSGGISLLDFVQSASGVYAIGQFQPAGGGTPVQMKLFFSSPGLAAIADGCQSGSGPGSGEYIGSNLSGTGWTHTGTAQFCPKATAEISIPSLQTPAHPVQGPHTPLPSPEPTTLLMLVSGLFATRTLFRKFA